MRKFSKPIVLALLGIGITSIAIFAPILSLDQNPGWGRLRIASLMIGVFTILLSVIYYKFENDFLLSHKFQTFILNSAIVFRLQNRRNIYFFAGQCRKYLFTLPFALFIVVFYVWFASNGQWTNWASPTRNYAYLAAAFQRGQLYLPIKPNPDLLNLPNPYDPMARKGIEYPIDYSLYKGKFYLYWGPVPGVFLAIVQPLFHHKIGDLYLAFGFLCGIFCLQFLFIIVIWDRFFSNLPKWLLLLTILITGLVSPNTLLLNNHVNGRIYEAAIFGCQFFLLAGLMMALFALNKSTPSAWKLSIAGVFWALAVGTRQVLIVSVALLVFITLYWLLRKYHLSLIKIIIRAISLTLPLIIGVILLGWYNWSRFGSIVETGYSYQLASPYLQKHLEDLFSPAYIFQNLYNYIFVPFDLRSKFPFIYLGKVNTTALFSWYSLPDLYNAEPFTGLLFAAPFVLFSIISIIGHPLRGFKKSEFLIEKEIRDHNIFAWMITSLIGSFLSAFFVLQLFFWIGMRYTADFMPSLILLSVISFWQGYKLLVKKPFWMNLYSITGIILASITIAVSTLQAITF